MESRTVLEDGRDRRDGCMKGGRGWGIEKGRNWQMLFHWIMFECGRV